MLEEGANGLSDVRCCQRQADRHEKFRKSSSQVGPFPMAERLGVDLFHALCWGIGHVL